ncbi:chain-length determining protein, partial [Thioclava sp. BHET1]
MQTSPEFKIAHPSTDQGGEDRIDIWATLSTLWRGRILIAICTAITIILGGLYAYKGATPYFTSTSVLMLQTSQETVTDIQSVVAGLSGDSDALNSEVEVVQSRELLGKVVDKLKLMQDPEFNSSLRPGGVLGAIRSALNFLTGNGGSSETAAERAQAQKDATISSLLSAMDVQLVPQTMVMQVSVTSTGSRKSALIADTIADLYVQDQISHKVAATKQASGWLTDRVQELQKQLETSETKLSDFNSATTLISADDLALMERQLKDLRERITSSEQAITQDQQQLTQIDGAATRKDRTAAANDAQLSQIYAQLAGAPGSAQLQAAFDQQFAVVKARIQGDINRQQAQVVTLAKSRDALGKQIKQQNQDLIRQQQLTREVEANRLLYQYFLGRLKETSAQQGIQQADSRVLSRAVVPSYPSQPSKARILVLSAMLGLMIGAGLVLLREFRQHTVRT